MSLLKSFDLKGIGPGIQSRPAPEIVVEGDPTFTSWPQSDGPVQVGVWGATPGAHKMARDDKTWEQFHLIEGEVEITEDGQPARRYCAGDTVIIEPNFKGIWRTITPVKKIYVSVTR